MAKKAMTGKQKAAASKAAAEKPAPKAKGAVTEGGTALVPLPKSALSVDVGPSCLKLLDKARADHATAQDLMKGVESSKFKVISAVTLAIIKAAKADKNITLSNIYSGDNKLKNELHNQLGIALGTRMLKEIKDGNTVTTRVVPSPAVLDFFPSAGEKKDSPDWARKETLRSNWTTLVGRAAGTACGVVDKGMTAAMDKKAGTLMISGPAVKAHFGADKVLLNENISQVSKDKPLKARPSFTAVRDIGAKENNAAPIGGKSNTRTGGQGQTTAAPKPVNADDAFRSMASQVAMALGKFSGPLEGKTKDAAEMLLNALQAKLQEGVSKLIQKAAA